jgi:Uma2 family endonuclease
MTLAPPATSLAWPQAALRRFSVDEYHRMIETGVLGEDDNVELLEGWIISKMSRNPPHDVCVGLAQDVLQKQLPRGFHLRIQTAITTKDSEPEPDIALVRGTRRDYASHHPSRGDVELVIEVAETSIERDRRKAQLYARSRIPRYWIVNIADRVVEVYDRRKGDSYAACKRAKEGEVLNFSVEGHNLSVKVADLLP